jgi:hypothetical protein
MTQRKWLAECHAWLGDPTSVQYETSIGWRDAWSEMSPITHPHYLWRIRPATITLNGTELPKQIKFGDSINPCALLINTPDCRLQKTIWFSTREDRDLVYAKLVEVLGS